jgi:hypothetical protein
VLKTVPLVLDAEVSVAILELDEGVAGSGQGFLGPVDAAVVHHGLLHLVANPDSRLGPVS